MDPTLVPEAARRFAMGFLMLVHIQFAAFIIGVLAIAVTFEFFGIINKGHPYLTRFARGLGKTGTLLYSSGAVLAFSFILLTALFWPVFWYTLFRITFWPFFLEAITFALSILYLFPWYFSWGALERFKWVHLSMGLALLMAFQFQQALIDVVASYMLTPAQATEFLTVFFNPTAVPLDMHRLVGDISWAGFAVAGYASYRALRTRDAEQLSYYDWMGNVGLIAGVGFLFLQPAIGIEYVEEIRANSPQAFTVMMRGRNSWLFLLQVTFLSALFLLGMYYMAVQARKSRRRGAGFIRWMLVVAILSALLLVQPYAIGPAQGFQWINWVNPIGSMQPWKYIAMAGLTLSSISSLLVYLGLQRKGGMRWGHMELGGRRAQYTLLVLAVLGSGMMLLMGYIRENSRLPFLIYYRQRIEQPERYPELTPTPAPAAPSSSNSPAEGVDPSLAQLSQAIFSVGQPSETDFGPWRSRHQRGAEG